MNINMVLLVASLLLLFSIIIGKAGVRFGIPALLLFLGLGMAFGTDGLGIEFDSPSITQFIGMLALSIILFSGGMDTKFREIKPVLGPGIMLATVGVALTTVSTGLFIYWITGKIDQFTTLSLTQAFLLAAVMSSTDSASVFSILRSKRLGLKENLRPMLELESGSNDPMAYMLTIFFINLVTAKTGEVDFWGALSMFVLQLAVGTGCGALFGAIAVWMMNRLKVDNQSMYPILLLAFVFLTFSATGIVNGNGYLAVYIAGLVVGNNKFQHKRNTTTFFDGFTWLFQIVLFLTLGLLVNPRDLLPIAGLGVLIGLFMIFVGRPLSVFLSLTPFRKISTKGRFYISWVGLRGAVPIIFATYPLIENLIHASLIFNIVFMCTLVSLIIQGSSVAYMAKLLGVGHIMPKERDNFGLELTEEIKSSTTEMIITPDMLSKGSRLMDMPLPESALVVMIKRNDNYFIPKGATRLNEGDKLLIITNNEEELQTLYARFGIEEYSIKNNE